MFWAKSAGTIFVDASGSMGGKYPFDFHLKHTFYVNKTVSSISNPFGALKLYLKIYIPKKNYWSSDQFDILLFGWFGCFWEFKLFSFVEIINLKFKIMA